MTNSNFINLDDILFIQETRNSNKTFWQVMGRFMGKKGTSVIIPPLQNNDGSYRKLYLKIPPL